jgi:hypothetical protein
MKLPNPAFLAFPSAAAALALGAFLWAGATPKVHAVVVDARALGGPRQGLSLGFSLQEDHFHQRTPTTGGTLEVALETLDARLRERVTLDANGHGTLVFPFDLARARDKALTVRLDPALVDGEDGEKVKPLPGGPLVLAPPDGPRDEAPHYQLAHGARTGPRTLHAYASQWPPPVEQAFVVSFRADGLTGADLAACALEASGEEGVTVERIASDSPDLLRARVFVPPLARTLAVTLKEPGGEASTWRGTLPNPAANMALEAANDGPDLVVRVRSNVPEGSYRAELVDEAGIVAEEPLAVKTAADGFGEALLRFPGAASTAPRWIAVREAMGSDVKVLAPMAKASDLLAALEAKRAPSLARWIAFDDYAASLKLAKAKRRRAMAGAMAASFVGTIFTLAGLIARRREEGAEGPLSIDGSRPVTDPKRGRPLLVLLVVTIFAMVALAASLSDL